MFLVEGVSQCLYWLFELQMLVIFCGLGVVKVGMIRLITVQITDRDSLTGLILVLQNNITNQAMKALDLFKFKIEIFQV